MCSEAVFVWRDSISNRGVWSVSISNRGVLVSPIEECGVLVSPIEECPGICYRRLLGAAGLSVEYFLCALTTTKQRSKGKTKNTEGNKKIYQFTSGEKEMGKI